jgi:hypothetical protein
MTVAPLDRVDAGAALRAPRIESALMRRSEIDVAAIMERIRSDNRARRERGLYTDEELLELARGRLRDYASQAAIDPRLLERFLGPGHDWNIATDYLIRTHRKGLVPRLSLVVKRLVRPVVRLYTDHVLNRQTQINQYLFHLLRRSILDVARLETQVAALQARCDALERRRPEDRA